MAKKATAKKTKPKAKPALPPSLHFHQAWLDEAKGYLHMAVYGDVVEGLPALPGTGRQMKEIIFDLDPEPAEELAELLKEYATMIREHEDSP